jgi:hypothetical protein
VSLEEDGDFPFCLVALLNMRPESFVARLANSHCQGWLTRFDVKTFRSHDLLPYLRGISIFKIRLVLIGGCAETNELLGTWGTDI